MMSTIDVVVGLMELMKLMELMEQRALALMMSSLRVRWMRCLALILAQVNTPRDSLAQRSVYATQNEQACHNITA